MYDPEQICTCGVCEQCIRLTEEFEDADLQKKHQKERGQHTRDNKPGQKRQFENQDNHLRI